MMKVLRLINFETMFRLFPKEWEDWARALFLFPFQAYTILAPAGYCYVSSIWPHRGGVTPLNNFGQELSVGFAICFFVLVPVGLRQRALENHFSAYVNLGLAILDGFFIFLTPNFIQT
jgi:hypothetical protein